MFLMVELMLFLSSMKNKSILLNKKLNNLIKKIDSMPLWIAGLLVLAVSFLPYILMGEGSVFQVHDQLDETICAYLLNARHLFERTDILPEMMGGIPASGLQPSAVLFVPLYRIFPLFTAFVIQYFVVSVSAFGGMYGLLKKITGSNGIAVTVGVLFTLLPFKPVYGLSVVGVPLLCLCFRFLYEQKRIWACIAGIVFFGLTTHLVLIGYVVLTYLGILAVYLIGRHYRQLKNIVPFLTGIAILVVVYCVVNYEMFAQLILGVGDFVSHRVEFVNATEGINIWRNICNVFLYGDMEYAPSYHWNILPVLCIITFVQGLRYKNLSANGKRWWKLLVVLWGLAVWNAVLYGLLNSVQLMEWQNRQNGFLRYFQADRYCWIYPSLWWIMVGVSLALVWKEFPKIGELIKLLVLMLAMLPTLSLIKNASNLYDNVNEYNHGSAYTGLPTWQEYYMQDVLAQVDAYIGREKNEYRVAHLGFNPTPSLVYGFYTVDGYSNNYPLEYKYRFRKVIEKELDKSEVFKIYYDTWGSRCYLFNGEDGLQLKNSDFVYRNLEFDVEALKQLGCKYIFSASEIAGGMTGIVLEDVFETEESIYEIWLYRIE